jgi:hypothetical protein
MAEKLNLRSKRTRYHQYNKIVVTLRNTNKAEAPLNLFSKNWKFSHANEW